MIILSLLVHCGFVIFSNLCHLVISLTLVIFLSSAKISCWSLGVMIALTNEQGAL